MNFQLTNTIYYNQYSNEYLGDDMLLFFEHHLKTSFNNSLRNEYKYFSTHCFNEQLEKDNHCKKTNAHLSENQSQTSGIDSRRGGNDSQTSGNDSRRSGNDSQTSGNVSQTSGNDSRTSGNDSQRGEIDSQSSGIDSPTCEKFKHSDRILNFIVKNGFNV